MGDNAKARGFLAALLLLSIPACDVRPVTAEECWELYRKLAELRQRLGLDPPAVVCPADRPRPDRSH